MRLITIKKILNIGIYAHVDAGKTTVTENLLFEAGVIRTIGRVDDGNTMTDQMTIERKRGISIQSTPVSFDYKNIKINLIDTPGHVDFIAEVERSMGVLDGAVLVISAKEGVQSHTILLYESLKKLKIPTLIFINKIDRIGVDIDAITFQIEKQLTENIVCLQHLNHGIVVDKFETDFDNLVDKMTYFSDALLTEILEEEKIDKDEVMHYIKSCTENNLVYPVFYGSALHQIGIKELLNGIIEYLPTSDYKSEGPLTGAVFKIKRNEHNKRQIYIRLYGGVIKSRQWLGDEKVSFLKGLRNGSTEYLPFAYGNDIVIIEGVDSLKVGDIIGQPEGYCPISLGEPTLCTHITCVDKVRLVECLKILAEADPFLEYKQDHHTGDIHLNLFGEIQMEILKEQLLDLYDLSVSFSPPQIIYKEMPMGIGEYHLDIYTDEQPFYATVGLRVEPSINGIEIESDVSTGFLPQRFQNGFIDGIRNYLKEGLHGWELTNLKVTLIKGGFNSVDSTPADFRLLTPIVFFEALERAKTKLLWTMNSFHIQVPNREYGRIMSDLMVMQASEVVSIQENDRFIIKGKLPIETSLDYEKCFISDTKGFGNYYTNFAGYESAPSHISKIRNRNMVSPLDRGSYLLMHMRTIK